MPEEEWRVPRWARAIYANTMQIILNAVPKTKPSFFEWLEHPFKCPFTKEEVVEEVVEEAQEDKPKKLPQPPKAKSASAVWIVLLRVLSC